MKILEQIKESAICTIGFGIGGLILVGVVMIIRGAIGFYLGV